jgi:ABC-type Mn2+/Zn2+ transport system ATPase subunit
MSARPELISDGADVDFSCNSSGRPVPIGRTFPHAAMGGMSCAALSRAASSPRASPWSTHGVRRARASSSGGVPVTRAAGKRDGRGSETWKDGRADAFDATGKDAVLIGKGLRKTHDGERYQFRNIDFALSEGQRVAIVGPNGSGKSTLLSVLAGKDVGREDGELWLRKDLNLAFLEQEPPFDPELGVLEAVYTRDTPLMRLLRRYEKVMADASAGHIDESKMAAVLEQMDTLEAWDTETKAHAALDKLGCSEFLSRKMGELSGGQRKRVALAAALIEEPDLLILDEPTNHLSVEGVEWLEHRLQQMTNTATLLVSHDRAFIDAVCSDILELDGTGGTHRHRGGYAAYLEGRETRWAAEAQRVAAAKNTLRKEQVRKVCISQIQAHCLPPLRDYLLFTTFITYALFAEYKLRTRSERLTLFVHNLQGVDAAATQGAGDEGKGAGRAVPQFNGQSRRQRQPDTNHRLGGIEVAAHG